jgi:hypothetical protein
MSPLEWCPFFEKAYYIEILIQYLNLQVDQISFLALLATMMVQIWNMMTPMTKEERSGGTVDNSQGCKNFH